MIRIVSKKIINFTIFFEIQMYIYTTYKKIAKQQNNFVKLIFYWIGYIFLRQVSYLIGSLAEGLFLSKWEFFEILLLSSSMALL